MDDQGRDEILMKYQFISDFFIALAYFSIPLELIYFVRKSSFFPYRWVLIQFGAFIVLCGATHFINLWTAGPHSETLDRIMTVAKISTAVISCATALMLVHVIPDLLSAKMREFFLKVRAEELDRVMGIMQKEKELEREIRVLMQAIRASMDSAVILQTAMAGLGRTFGLEECAIWTPSPSGFELRLSQTLRHHSLVGSAVPLDLPLIGKVCNTNQATRIPHTSPIARICPFLGRHAPPEVVAVRVPLPAAGRRSFAVMVLMLPPDSGMKWRPHELELVPVVADQMATALVQAAILEESARCRSQLEEQNLVLGRARREAERAVGACNNFLAVMNHGMRTPLQSVISLSSFLLEADLAPELRMMVETVLKSSSLMAALLRDAYDVARLQNGELGLECAVFNLPSLFKEVLALVRPIAAAKQLSVTLTLAPDLPSRVVGDAKRLATIILNLVGNAVKFTQDGFVSVAASVAGAADSFKEDRFPEPLPPAGETHVYLRVQVKDSGCGISPQDLPTIFNQISNPQSCGGKLGLALCKRFVNLMGGQMWIDSEGIQKGCTAVFIVKLGLRDNERKAVDFFSPSRPQSRTWHQRIS